MSGVKRVAHAAETIRARWEQRVDESPQMEAAQALEDSCQLLDPEVAEELKRLREENPQLQARVAELERQLAATDRPVDEDPIAFALTEKAEQPADMLTRTFVPVASLREDVPWGEHYPAVHRAYRLGHDRPETGGAQ